MRERFCVIWLSCCQCKWEIEELYIQDSATSSAKNKNYIQQLDLKLPYYKAIHYLIFPEGDQSSVQLLNVHFLGWLTRSDISAAALDVTD